MSKQNERDESLEAADDELAPYSDLVGALRAPGSASELADEQHFLAAFRDTHGPSSPVVSLPSRLARRLGTGGSAVIVVVAVSSGVAAAVTGNLPDPVQEFAHSVLGAPAPEAPAIRQATTPKIKPLPEPGVMTTAPAESSSPPTDSSDVEKPNSDNPGRPSPASPAEPPAANPGGAPPLNEPDVPTKGATPPPAPRPKPAALTMSGSSHLAPYGGTLTLNGQVTAKDGEPIAGRKLVLQVRDLAGWRSVLAARSDSAGLVTAQTAPVTGLDRYRWRVRAPLRSPVWRVRVKPAISASYVVNGDQTTITAAIVGAGPGDSVNLYAKVKKQPTVVDQALVRADGTAEFTLATPARRSRMVVVRLEKTRDHAPARTRLKVAPPA